MPRNQVQEETFRYKMLLNKFYKKVSFGFPITLMFRDFLHNSNTQKKGGKKATNLGLKSQRLHSTALKILFNALQFRSPQTFRMEYLGRKFTCNHP